MCCCDLSWSVRSSRIARWSATIRVLTRDELLTVEVTDNGRGGARPTAGSGLGGLKDRVEALDGTFDVQSPRGKGTCVRAELPLAIGS